MTANQVSTALLVLAVLSASFAAGIALAPGAARSAAAQVTTTQYSAAGVSPADIDSALAQGPVFVEFETKECGYCRQQKPISEALADEYRGKVTFFFVDATENRGLANQFQVSGVPQMDVILKKSGGYTYVGEGGKPSESVTASRFLGLTPKDTLKTALDAAVRARGL